MSVNAIGIDLGGSNLRVAAFGDDHLPLEVHREPVGDERSPEEIVERLARAAEQFVTPAMAGVIPIGVGIAAMLSDRVGTVANSPHLRWRDVPFGMLLARRLGPRFAIGVYNDVNAITWGEAVAGAARGCRDVLAVYVGTGIGGGIIANGQLLEGATSCAGEIGHVKVRWDEAAAPCACGGRGCVEAYVGGSYVVRRIVSELSKKGARSAALVLAGSADQVTPSHVDQAAADGDDWALGLWTELAPMLGVALANALCITNSERLILGGGMLSRTPTLYALAEAALLVAMPSGIRGPLEVVPAELGDDAGLVGAARLAAGGFSTIAI